MSRLFVLFVSFFLFLIDVDCEGRVGIELVGRLEEKSVMGQEFIDGSDEGVRPTTVIDDDIEKIIQTLVTEALEYPTLGNLTGPEEKSRLNVVKDLHHPIDDTLVNRETSLSYDLMNPYVDSIEPTEEGKTKKHVIDFNTDESINIGRNSSEHLKCSNLLKNQILKTESSLHDMDDTDRIHLSTNLNGKVLIDEPIPDSFEESSPDKQTSNSVIIGAIDRENNTDSKEEDKTNYKIEDGDLSESSSFSNFPLPTAIIEPTFATTDLTPTIVSHENNETFQGKPYTEINLNSSKYYSDESEQNVFSSFMTKISNVNVTNKEQQSEMMPYPEKLFAYSLERTDSGNSLIDISSDISLQKVTIPQPLHDKEDILNQDKSSSDLPPGTLFENCYDCDVRILPITPLGQRSTPTAEEESLPSSKIIFSELPEGREIQINSLGLSKGIFLFSYISEFLSWIQPNDFPVELLRDALKNEMSWISLITQSLRVEVGFVACLVAGVLLALAVPIVVLSHACYRMGGRSDDCGEDNGGWAGNCRRRTLVFVLQLLLVLLW